MKLNEIKDNDGRDEGAHSRRSRHRFGQGQAVRPRRQGPDRAFGRAHQGLRGRPDAAASPAAQARLQPAVAAAISTRSIWAAFRPPSTPASSTLTAPIDVEALIAAGVVSRARDGVKILGKGELKAKADFEVYGASKSAVAAIEKAGGSVKSSAAAATADSPSPALAGEGLGEGFDAAARG